MTVPRPGHADLTGALKYGYGDLRESLERASARETTARVAAGAICRKLLAQFGIRVGSYVTAIGDVTADLTDLELEERLRRAGESEMNCPSAEATEAMRAAVQAIMQARDTLGGVFEVDAQRRGQFFDLVRDVHRWCCSFRARGNGDRVALVGAAPHKSESGELGL